MPVERATRATRGFRRAAAKVAVAAVRERPPSLRTRLVYAVAFLANALVLAALLWALVAREPDKEDYTEKALDIGSGRSGSGTDGATHSPKEHFVSDQPSEPVGEDFEVTKHPTHRARTIPTRKSTPLSDKGEVEYPTTCTTTTHRTSTGQRAYDTSSEWTVPSTNRTTEYASTTSISEVISSTVPITTSDYVTTNLRAEEATHKTSSTTTTEETLNFDVDTSPSYNVVCYFNHTSYKRDEPMTFRTGHIPVPYCSHIIYASLGVGEDFRLVAKDHLFDVERGGFIKFARLKSRYRHVRVMAAIGEDISDSNAFRHMSKNRADVVTFARNVESWLREYEYDGAVLQWKMPVQRQDDTGGRASLFRKKLLVVVGVLRETLDARTELFVALPSNEEIRQAYFNVVELARYVDRFLAISNWVLRDDGDTDGGAKLTSFPDPLNDVLQTRHSLVGAGNLLLFRKFCFVLSVSARSYTLLNPGRHEIHATALGPGKPGPFTRQPGVLAYYEFCNETWPTAEKGTFASYVARDDQWVGYLDVSNVQRLLRMALYKHRAACLGIWDVSLDDFRGICGDAFPYVKAISGWHDKEWKRRRREFGSGRNK
ncbi:chitinase-3-like protein 1 isoform X2 [Rhipicephalus microplus]|uniref:chitinase-3-like protein 1 isoform X2 n=1 Tax=Rhipicephalus microplus TaxID=6941 RepID=UPI003F6C57AA